MGAINIKLTGHWHKMRLVLNGRKMSKFMKSEFFIAHVKNSELAIKDIKNRIQRGEDSSEYANAMLTVDIKNSTTPLIGKGGGTSIFQALDWTKIDSASVFAGIHRKEAFFRIARVIHEGYSIPVTDKMRGMFRALYIASQDQTQVGKLTGAAKKLWSLKPGGWLPLKDSTTTIVFPKRPFIERTFKDRRLRKAFVKNYEIALRNAFNKNLK